MARRKRRHYEGNLIRIYVATREIKPRKIELRIFCSFCEGNKNMICCLYRNYLYGNSRLEIGHNVVYLKNTLRLKFNVILQRCPWLNIKAVDILARKKFFLLSIPFTKLWSFHHRKITSRMYQEKRIRFWAFKWYERSQNWFIHIFTHTSSLSETVYFQLINACRRKSFQVRIPAKFCIFPPLWCLTHYLWAANKRREVRDSEGQL